MNLWERMWKLIFVLEKAFSRYSEMTCRKELVCSVDSQTTRWYACGKLISRT